MAPPTISRRRWNEQVFDRYRLKQIVMKDVSSVDTSVTLLGKACAMPLALAPVGMAGMMARRGEVQGARAAKAAGIPFTTATLGVCDVDEIREATATPPWFQLYMLRDRDVVLSLLERARAAGCDTLLFTDDLAVPGIRLREQWQGKLVIKGVMEPEDAREAMGCGADGIVVSNHGGRQLDGGVRNGHGPDGGDPSSGHRP